MNRDEHLHRRIHLQREGQNYGCIHERLRRYSRHRRIQQSVRIIRTHHEIPEVTEDLEECLYSNDTLFFGELNGDTMGSGFNHETNMWIQRALQNSKAPLARHDLEPRFQSGRAKVTKCYCSIMGAPANDRSRPLQRQVALLLRVL